MPGSVKQEKEKKKQTAHKLSESRRMQFMRNASGEVHEVLFEKRGSRRNSGRTDRQLYQGDDALGKGLPGHIRQVRLTTLRDDSSMN
jgi:tRNA A37 methylthiotransferase MiaB